MHLRRLLPLCVTASLVAAAPVTAEAAHGKGGGVTYKSSSKAKGKAGKKKTKRARNARTSLLKGTVSGAPYVASSTLSAVPVIFSKQTAKRAGLISPVGIIVVPRRGGVPTPDGRVSVSRLRLGDRFRFSTTVPAEAKKAVYTRLATKKLVIYKRSKNLSTAELELMVKRMQKQLNALQDYVGKLTTYTVTEIASLRADLNALRADLEALRNAVRSLENLSAELKAQIDKLAADLAQTIKDLAALTQTVQSLQLAVGNVQTLLLQNINSLTGKTLTTVTDALADLADINTQLARVKSATDFVKDGGETTIANLSTAVFGGAGTADDLTTRLSSVETNVTTLQGKVNTLENVVCNTTNGLAVEFNQLRTNLLDSSLSSVITGTGLLGTVSGTGPVDAVTTC